MSNIFQDVVNLGIEFDHHYSDLYLPFNEKTQKLVNKYAGEVVPSTFINQVVGGVWYDLAFQYLPYWKVDSQDYLALLERNGDWHLISGDFELSSLEGYTGKVRGFETWNLIGYFRNEGEYLKYAKNHNKSHIR